MNLPSSSAYRTDRELLKSLGLEVFKNLPYGTEKLLGTVRKEKENALVEIDVYVTCYPAQFYRFEVSTFSKESNMKKSSFSISTGSGNFSDLWLVLEPMLTMMADGMLTISPEKNA